MNNEFKVTHDIKQIGRYKLPITPFENIAISLSGGGYRATSFHLGTLSYLSSKKWFDVSLLERTRIISTVSAGTFIGVKYVTTIKKGGTIEDCYKSVYSFMKNCDLATEALSYLSNDDNWHEGIQRSLINSFSAIYYQKFESEVFNLLWDEKEIHLKEICFNATEFNFALPFCFYKTENNNKKHENIGNRKIYIPLEVAKEIRFADIIAASSCFPFGFEPINFPDDFIYADAKNLKDASLLPKYAFDGDKIEYPIGLMDGSVYDNQGIDAVVASERRMKQYHDERQAFRSDDLKAVDLFILSDVSSPNTESYIRSTPNKIPYIGNWNFASLKTFGLCSVVIGFISILLAFYHNTKFVIISLSVFGTIGLLLALILLVFSSGITGIAKRFGVSEYELKRILHFDKLKFETLYNLFLNRSKSGKKLVSDVFIRQMKWISFERIFSDASWKPRILMNASRKLNGSEVEKRKKKHHYLNEELLYPGKLIISASEKANTKTTTLWFSDKELAGDQNMLDTIIASGQYTTCFNLLEYIERTIKHELYTTDYENYSIETKAAIDQLHQSLMEDWIKFKKDPYWMVNEWNKLNAN